MPFKSLLACCAAPSPGVLVTAPDKIPTIVVIGVPVVECRIIVMVTPNTTTSIASIFRVKPPFLNAEKKPGPTCKPIE